MLVKSLRRASPSDVVPASVNSRNKNFNPVGYVSCDCETTGLHTWHDARPFAVGMCDQDGNTWYCEWVVDPRTRAVTPNLSDVAFIKSIIGNPDISKVYHNARFDIRMLNSLGIENIGWFDDTFIASRVANTLENAYGLKYLAKKYAGMDDRDEKELDDAVKIARRRAQATNRQHLRAWPSTPVPYTLSESAAADTWLVRHFFPENSPEWTLCEKYCRKDCERTAMLIAMYRSVMSRDEEVRLTYMREMELWHTVWGMEGRGVRVDLDVCRQEKETCQGRVDEALANMHSLLRNDLKWSETEVAKFNPGSSQQTAKIVYDGYKIPITRAGTNEVANERTTNFRMLESHITHPFIRALIQHRMNQKVVTTFYQMFEELSTPDTLIPGGKVLHPGFNQVGTVTGRFSCSSPNMQQISDSETGQRTVDPLCARGPFGPREGYVMYCIDYSQQEVRIFADLSRSQFLLDSIARGEDLYEATSNRVWGGRNNPHAVMAAYTAMEFHEEYPQPGIAQEQTIRAWEKCGWKRNDVHERGAKERGMELARQMLEDFNYNIIHLEKFLGKKKVRSRSKIVFLAKIYGGGAERMAPLMGASVDQTRIWLAQFDTAIPDIKIFMRNVVGSANRDGFIVNPYGRKLRIDQGFSYRAVNYLIQGTAADMVKAAMVQIDQAFQRSRCGGNLLLSVHDEIIYEIPKRKDRPWIHRQVKQIMEDNPRTITEAIPYGASLTLPMITDLSRAVSRWDQKVRIDI